MAMRIKRAETGVFSPSSVEDRTQKSLVDRQLGYEKEGRGLVIQDDITIEALSFRNHDHVYYVDGSYQGNSGEFRVNGTQQNPFITFEDLFNMKKLEQQVLVYLKNCDNQDIELKNLTGWTITGGLATKDGSRCHVNDLKISGTSTSCYVIGVTVDNKLSVEEEAQNNYFRYCTIKDQTLVSQDAGASNGYTCFELCSFMKELTIMSGAVDLLNSAFEQQSVVSTSAGVTMFTNCRNVSLEQIGGTCVSLGATNFQPSANLTDGTTADKYTIVRSNGVLLLLNGESLQPSGALAPIKLFGSQPFTLGKFLFSPTDSQIPTSGEILDSLQARQLVDNQVLTSINPASGRQSDINAAINATLQALSASSTTDRGVVLNAYTSRLVYAVDSITTAAQGTGYAVGDLIFLEAANAILNCWVIVATVGGGGEVLTCTMSTPGAYETDPSGDRNTSTTGSGTGCVLSASASQQDSTTTRNLGVGMRHGDTCTVLENELSADETWQFIFADQNGAGVGDWIPRFRINSDNTYAADGTSIVMSNNTFSLASSVQTTLGEVSSKANDSDVVHKTGSETINGTKTFLIRPTYPSSSEDFSSTPMTSLAATQAEVANSARNLITTVGQGAAIIQNQAQLDAQKPLAKYSTAALRLQFNNNIPYIGGFARNVLLYIEDNTSAINFGNNSGVISIRNVRTLGSVTLYVSPDFKIRLEESSTQTYVKLAEGNVLTMHGEIEIVDPDPAKVYILEASSGIKEGGIVNVKRAPGAKATLSISQSIRDKNITINYPNIEYVTAAQMTAMKTDPTTARDNLIYISDEDTTPLAVGGLVDVNTLVTTNTAQTISAVKTFSALPETNTTPTTDNQLVRKKYVDDCVRYIGTITGTTGIINLGDYATIEIPDGIGPDIRGTIDINNTSNAADSGIVEVTMLTNYGETDSYLWSAEEFNIQGYNYDSIPLPLNTTMDIGASNYMWRANCPLGKLVYRIAMPDGSWAAKIEMMFISTSNTGIGGDRSVSYRIEINR